MFSTEQIYDVIKDGLKTMSTEEMMETLKAIVKDAEEEVLEDRYLAARDNYIDAFLGKFYTDEEWYDFDEDLATLEMKWRTRGQVKDADSTCSIAQVSKLAEKITCDVDSADEALKKFLASMERIKG